MNEVWLFKTCTYLGLALLAGGAFWRRLSPRFAFSAGWLALGGLLVLGGGLLEVLGTLRNLLGPFDFGDFTEYLLSSVQGQAVLARVALAAALLAFEVQADPARRGLLAWGPSAVAGVLLLASVSATGHGRAAGPVTFLLDILHLVAMVLWAGAVASAAWQPHDRWSDEDRALPAVSRVSAVGLAGVLTLTLTGSVAAVVHLKSVGAITGTAYGLALLWKLGAFALVLGLAALNRFSLLRAARLASLRRALRVESVVLVAVLGLSGLLASSATPDPPKEGAERAAVKVRLGGAEALGEVAPDGLGGAKLVMTLPSGVPLRAHLEMLDHSGPDLPMKLTRSGDRVEGQARLFMAGRHALVLESGGETARVEFDAR